MVSACIGESYPLLVELFAAGVELMAAVHQWAETRDVLINKLGHDEEWVDAQIERLINVVRPIHPAVIEPHRDRALSRLPGRAARDWPVLAGSYAVKAGTWSHDKHLWGTGAAIWFTRTLRHEMRQIASERQNNA